MTITVPTHQPTDFLALIRRMGMGDRAALQVLHTALREPISDRASRALSRAGDVQAVVDATFVEAFWMSRFYDPTDVDVLAWMHKIANQRATERLRLADPPIRPRHDDESTRLTLHRLLDPASALGLLSHRP